MQIKPYGNSAEQLGKSLLQAVLWDAAWDASLPHMRPSVNTLILFLFLSF